MKNKPRVTDQRSQAAILDWLYQEELGDDFLIGKAPSELVDIWEDEE